MLHFVSTRHPEYVRYDPDSSWLFNNRVERGLFIPDNPFLWPFEAAGGIQHRTVVYPDLIKRQVKEAVAASEGMILLNLEMTPPYPESRIAALRLFLSYASDAMEEAWKNDDRPTPTLLHIGVFDEPQVNPFHWTNSDTGDPGFDSELMRLARAAKCLGDIVAIPSLYVHPYMASLSMDALCNAWGNWASAAYAWMDNNRQQRRIVPIVEPGSPHWTTRPEAELQQHAEFAASHFDEAMLFGFWDSDRPAKWVKWYNAAKYK